MRNRLALSKDGASSSGAVFAYDSSNGNDNIAFLSLDSSSTSSLNSLPASPSTKSICGDSLFSQTASSESVPSKGRGSHLESYAHQNQSEKYIYSGQFSENSSRVSVDCSRLCMELPENPLQSSDGAVLSSYEEVLTIGNPETKEPNLLEDLHLVQRSAIEVGNEETSSSTVDYKHGMQTVYTSEDAESGGVHDIELLKCCDSQDQGHDLSNGITRNSLEVESAAMRHEFEETVSQLKEQLKQSEAEKEQLQAELGRYHFLEDKERRSEKFLLSMRSCGSDHNRLCAASANSLALTTMEGRLLGSAAPLKGPSK